MAWIRSEEDVDKLIEGMKNKSGSRYITQGVAFDKTSERHMELLKLCLLHSNSFSGLVKELIANRFSNDSIVKQVEATDFPATTPNNNSTDNINPTFNQSEISKKANASNFF